MSKRANKERCIRCVCGQVEVALQGEPILSAVCYCDDCQEAAKRLEALPQAPAIRDPDGGTPLVLWREDRVEVVKGKELLEAHTLLPDSPTDRMVASCCNSAIYLNFRKGHWLSIYQHRFDDPPPMQLRLQTKFMPDFDATNYDTPTYKTFPLKFIAKLLAVRVAMFFGR